MNQIKGMSQGIARRMNRFAVALLAFLTVSAAASAQQFAIGAYHLQSSVRTSPTQYEYTYTADVTNSGGAAPNVVGTVTSNSPNTLVIQGVMPFGAVPANGTTTSVKTFVIEQDRRFAFNPSDLVWTFAIPPAATWLIGESGISSLDKVPGANQVFADSLQPPPQVILQSRNNVNSGVGNDCVNPTAFDAQAPAPVNWNAVYIYRYTAECQLAVDLAAPSGGPGFRGAIPPWITWVMYDNELCTLPATPLAEQQNPPVYYSLAANLAHMNGLKFYATAGLHQAAVGSDGSCGAGQNPAYQNKNSPINVFQLWATAYLWDGWDAQVQTGISDPATMIKNTQNQLSNAQFGGLRTDAIVAAGIGNLGCYSINGGTTSVCGPIDPGTQEQAVRGLFAIGVHAFWGNYGPHPQPPGHAGDGLCTAPTITPPPPQLPYSPGNPYGTCSLIATGGYATFGQIIVDIYSGHQATALGPYGN